MIEATQKGLRTTVVALLLIAAVALTALSFHRRDSRLTVQWDFLHWHFGAYEKRDTVGITPVSSIVLTSLTRHHTTVRKGYHLGPLTVFTWWDEDGPDWVGTNALTAGDRLFNPATKRELWKVLAVESQHEFEDGTERDGVLVRDLVSGGKAWVPRTNLNKALLVRER
jgi:hypothetical protein